MAKVLIVNPVIRQSDKPRHVPFGLAQLAGIIMRDGHKIQVFDANAWRPSDKQIRSVLRADDWDVIAIGGLVTSYGFIKSFVKKARAELPTCNIVVGGGVITPIPREVMGFCPEIDIGVLGEGYLTFPEVLKYIDDGARRWDEVKGIAWRTTDGEIRINEARELLEDLDTLPFPAWDLFPLDIYFTNSSLLLSEEAMLSERRIEFCCSYGCPFKCKYCFHLGLSGELQVVEERGSREVRITRNRRVRLHSPEYVVELSQYAKDEFDADFISFLDENFLALDKLTSGKWFDNFEKLWLQNGLQPACEREGEVHDPGFCKGIHWGTTAHPSLVNLPLLKRLRSLGCSHLDFGFESFSDEILKRAGKGATAKMNTNALKVAMAANIRAIPNQILGFPEESFESILLNIKAWDQLGIKAFPFFATPYPGSEWYYTYKEKILSQYDGDLEAFLLDLGDATNLTAVISENFNAVELLGLRELMVSRNTKRIKEYQKIWKKNRAHEDSTV